MTERDDPNLAGRRHKGRYKTIMDVTEDVEMEEEKVEQERGGRAEVGDGGA